MIVYHTTSDNHGLKKINTRFVFIILLIFVKSVNSQQLIFNGSFERVNVCDELNASCSPSAWFYLNRIATQGYAKEGGLADAVQNRYFRILVARSDSIIRQYWETMLACNLEAGKRYKASFLLASQEIGPNLNDFGFYFCNDFIFAYGDSLLQPEIYIDFKDAKVRKRKNYWFFVEKEFVAPYNARFLIIGNFAKAGNVEIMKRRVGKEKNIYLWVDDISIKRIEKNECHGYQQLQDSLYNITSRHIKSIAITTTEKKSVLTKEVGRHALVPKIDTIRLNNIEFAFNKYTLKKPEILDAYRKQFEKPGIQKIIVLGYTDSAGSEIYNKDLSFRRAKEIAGFIHTQYRIDESLILYEGKGESIDYNEEYLNRRVEIYIYYN
ncbi:MAG: OmpA family protein [Chitinophagaceae bacterium]